MTDIVDRLHCWVIATAIVSASDIMDEAADEIARLRLTDAEREAILFFAASHNAGYAPFATHTGTLYKLLERMK